MGLLSKLFSKSIFKPDLSKTEYDNQIIFFDNGGTSEEWESLKKKNSWIFKEDPIDSFLRYEKEMRPIFDKYYELTKKIDKQWSILCDSKDYTCDLALKIENECYEAIDYYKKLQDIDSKHNQKPMTGSKVFTKLPLLYERQGKTEEAIKACKIACSLGIDESNRLVKLIKKNGRDAYADELDLIKKYTKSTELKFLHTESENTNKDKTKRRNIPSEKIDQMQRIEASDAYKNNIYNIFYKKYPEKPYISQDREFNTNWLEQAKMFEPSSIVPISMMTRYKDNLLPGHIYMLYWIKKYKYKRRIPSYFEYRYGIDFERERIFLVSNNYLGTDGLPTEKGLQAIQIHHKVIEQH